MIPAFSFATADRILFGSGRARELDALAGALGQRAALVTGKNPARWSAVTEALSLSTTLIKQSGEPSIADLDQAVATARAFGAEVIIGLGGGSAIDLAKAVSVMLTNPGSALDYLEVIGEGQPFSQPALSCIAIPTTAGTGAEVTKNAVLFSPEHRVKVSMRHESMLPDIALIDPELTLSCPPLITAQVGMDALVQVIEPFLSHLANPFTDALCRSAIPLAMENLPRAVHHGQDRDAREAMAWVSVCGGLALANAKLGAVHGIAGPLGGMKTIAHGAACARLLPSTLRVNAEAIARQEQPVAQQRLDELVQLSGNNSLAEFATQMEQWLTAFNIPGLAACGLSEDEVPVLADKAKNSSSMKGNPVELQSAEIERIIRGAMG